MFTKDNPKGEWHSAGKDVREAVTSGTPDGPSARFNLVAVARDAKTANQIAQAHNASLK